MGAGSSRPGSTPDASRDGHQTCAWPANWDLGKKFIFSNDPRCEIMQESAAMFLAIWKEEISKRTKVNTQEKHKESEQNRDQNGKKQSW